MIMRTFFTLISSLAFIVILSSCSTLPHGVHPTTVPIQITTSTVELPNAANPDLKLQGTRIDFPYEISTYLVDKNKMQICLIAKETPKKANAPVLLLLYDLKEKKLLWSKKTYAWTMAFTDQRVVFYGFKSSFKTFGLDRENGNVVWQMDQSFYHPIKLKDNHIAFSGMITAFDMNTGLDLWSKKITNEYGWIDRKVIDEEMIASVDGLHRFNLKTGEGWSLVMTTGKTDHAKAVGANIASGILGGGYIPPEKITGLSSNILKQDDRVYFSATDDLHCIDYTSGKEIWHTELKEKKTGNVCLFLNKDKLILVNKGSSYRNGLYQKYGHPYIAMFDMTTGQELMWRAVDVEVPVKDVSYTKEDGFYLLTEDNILFYDYQGELKCKSGRVDKKTTNGIVNKAFNRARPFYIPLTTDQNVYQSLYSLKKDSNAVTLITNNGVSFINEQCNSEQDFSNSEMQEVFAITDDFLFMNPPDELISDPINPGRYTLTLLSRERNLLGSFSLPKFSRDRCEVLGGASEQPVLFYFNDNKSIVLCPLSPMNKK